jgi:hypothetical protein
MLASTIHNSTNNQPTTPPEHQPHPTHAQPPATPRNPDQDQMNGMSQGHAWPEKPTPTPPPHPDGNNPTGRPANPQTNKGVGVVVSSGPNRVSNANHQPHHHTRSHPPTGPTRNDTPQEDADPAEHQDELYLDTVAVANRRLASVSADEHPHPHTMRGGRLHTAITADGAP